MSDSENMWKYRKVQSKSDMLRRLISLGVVLQLIANIGEIDFPLNLLTDVRRVLLRGNSFK